MDSMYDITVMFVGQPADDIEHFLIYFIAAIIYVQLFTGIMYLIRLFGSWTK